MEKKNGIISACLLGVPCRYDGKSRPCEAVFGLFEKYNLIPVCPEVFGGLPTPRIPSERVENRVVMRDGTDVTEKYLLGSEAVLKLCELYSADIAILKARSPACGHGEIYDGNFSGTLVAGDGICVECLLAHGIKVYTEEEIDKLL